MHWYWYWLAVLRKVNKHVPNDKHIPKHCCLSLFAKEANEFLLKSAPYLRSFVYSPLIERKKKPQSQYQCRYQDEQQQKCEYKTHAKENELVYNKILYTNKCLCLCIPTKWDVDGTETKALDVFRYSEWKKCHLLHTIIFISMGFDSSERYTLKEPITTNAFLL